MTASPGGSTSDKPADMPLDPAKLPQHVAVIMDGNGRWAKSRGLPRLAGHRAGTEALRRLIESCVEFGIPYLTIYAFSTENWKRPPHEVRGLMFLLEEVIERQLEELDELDVRLKHVGWFDGVPKHICQKISEAVERTADNRRLTVSVAFNYGARLEIVRAVRAVIDEGLRPAEIDQSRFEEYLETSGLPDPDLVIRTSGEMRLSNFLLWQVAYSEIYCTDTLWPDFDRHELWRALQDYASRDRRFGGRPEPKAKRADGGAPETDVGDVGDADSGSRATEAGQASRHRSR
jgi:undecaprenyl diphosphate synthase